MTDAPKNDDSLLLDWLERSDRSSGAISEAVEILGELFSGQLEGLRDTLKTHIERSHGTLEHHLERIDRQLRESKDQNQGQFSRLEERLGSLEESIDTLREHLEDLEENEKKEEQVSEPAPDASRPVRNTGEVLVIQQSLTAEYVLRFKLEGVPCRMKISAENGGCKIRLRAEHRDRHNFESCLIDGHTLEFSARLTLRKKRHTFHFSIRNGAKTISIAKNGETSKSVPYEVVESGTS